MADSLLVRCRTAAVPGWIGYPGRV